MDRTKLAEGLIYLEAPGPRIQLKDTTPSTGLNVGIRNLLEKLYAYNIGTGLTIAPIYPCTEIIVVPHRPTNPSTGAAETATLAWKETIFACPPGASFEVVDVGYMPNAAFGRASYYATLTCRNKGANGTGDTEIASRAFSSAATVNAMNSFGAISNVTIEENETITIEKTVTSSGQIVTAGAHYLFLRRIL